MCVDEANSLVKVLGELCVLHEGLTLGADALLKFDGDELQGVFAVEEIVKIVIQTRKILELFCKQFDEFAKTVNHKIEIEVLAQFALLCDKLERIELELLRHDLAVCSKIPALDQKINRAEDRLIIAIGVAQHAITLCNNLFKDVLSDAQAAQIVNDQNMLNLLMQVQKNIGSLCQSLLTDLHLEVLAESDQDITYNNQARKIIVDGYQDAQAELCQAQLNMLSALNDDTLSLQTLLLTQASVLRAKLCSLENNMSNTIKQNSQSLKLMIALNGNEVCKQLSSVQVMMGLNHNQLEVALSDFITEISRQNIGLASKLATASIAIDKRLILEFGLLEANLVALAQQLITKICLVHDEIIVQVNNEFAQLECTLAQYQDSIRSQLTDIQVTVEGTAKAKMQQTCKILLGGMGELTSKIGTLSSDTCLFNTQISNGLEKLDADITGVLCRKMSNFNAVQRSNIRELSNNIAAIETGILTGVTSKLSQFETSISRQRDTLSSKLAVFESTIINQTAVKLNSFACNTAMRQGALCSKVGAIEAGLEAQTQVQVSSFTTNVSQQLDAICAALIEAQINLVEVTQSSVDSAESQVDMRYEDLCVRIESGMDVLESEQEELCLQISELDEFIQSNIEFQAEELFDDLDALQFKADAIELSLEALSFLAGFLAGRTAPIPPLV
jgi:hypothetical protein